MRARRSWHPSEESALAAALSEPETMPLGSQLSGAPRDTEVHRMWQRASASSVLAGRTQALPHRFARFALLSTAAAALACALTLVFWLRVDKAGPLLAGDAPLPTTFQASNVASTVVLSDGSRIRLEPEARLDILGNDERTFVTTLRHGRALFEVEPGGPRRWVIEAGLLSVEVVGTIFSVDREEGSVTVTVERGIVLVRGEIAGSERRLTAGQSLVARGASRAESASTQALAQVVPEPAASSRPRALTLDELPEEAADVDAPSATVHGSGANPPGTAPTLPVPPPSAAAADAIDAVLSEADAARRAGDVARAAALYERAAVQASSGDPRRGMAALSFARLGTNPARAAALLEASQSGMPPALAEAALAHLAEAYGNAGQTEAATAAARRYIETYPHHPRAEKVKRWLRAP